MRSKIQRWGNSLAIRIPAAFAKECHLHNNSEVNIFMNDHQIIVTLHKPKLALSDLLAQITKENLHDPIETGPTIGKEEI